MAVAFEDGVIAWARDSPELLYCSVGNIHFLLKLLLKQGKETSPSEGRPSNSHCLHLRPPPKQRT